jgi:hypothetical protein
LSRGVLVLGSAPVSGLRPGRGSSRFILRVVRGSRGRRRRWCGRVGLRGCRAAAAAGGGGGAGWSARGGAGVHPRVLGGPLRRIVGSGAARCGSPVGWNPGSGRRGRCRPAGAVTVGAGEVNVSCAAAGGGNTTRTASPSSSVPRRWCRCSPAVTTGRAISGKDRRREYRRRIRRSSLAV